MKIAFFADTHLGYTRFEQDSYIQAERVIENASARADILICAGDVFDTKVPKLETLKKAIEIFRKTTVPIYVIHGNHERRTRELTNPVQLLASASNNIKLLHSNSETIEREGELVQIFGLGSVPEEYAKTALEKVLPKFVPDENAFRILVIHQTISELMPIKKDDELSIEYLETLPFDLIVNGHIHETTVMLDGRFLIPGSTVITQLRKEQADSRGYFLYDTKTKTREFVPIHSRELIFEELEFEKASENDVRAKARERIGIVRKGHPDAIVSIKLKGTMADGTGTPDLRFDGMKDIFIDNKLDSAALGAKLEKIREMRGESMGARELAVSELCKKTNGKIKLFDSAELFDALAEGVDEAIVYLERKKIQQANLNPNKESQI